MPNVAISEARDGPPLADLRKLVQNQDDLGIDAADVDRIRRIMAELDASDVVLLDPPAAI